MINAFGYFALFLGMTMSCQALAYENLIGEYVGKLTDVEGYSGDTGDPCTVTVVNSDMYGGALVFEIRNAEKLSMETRSVQKALEQQGNLVRVVTPGSSAKPAEIVVMVLARNGTLRSLKLMQKWGARHQEKSVTCGDLSKK